MTIDNTLDHTINSEVMIQMMAVAQASMGLWDAENTADHTRYNYHRSIQRYEERHGPLVGRLSAESKAHAAIREFTAKTYEAHQIAKRKVYNAKRRLNNACIKLTLIRGRTALALRG
jgi:hypothetical protein